MPQPKAKPRREKAERWSPQERRRQLISVASRLIAERGMESLRTRDIAAAAKINIATLHYHFPTKEALVQAVIADLIALGTSVGRGSLQVHGRQSSVALRPMHRLESRYFLRLLTLDRPGVMASVATVLGDRGISLASVVQKESVVLGDDVPGAEIVLTTHAANEAAVQEAISVLAQMPVVRTIGALYRVFE